MAWACRKSQPGNDRRTSAANFAIRCRFSALHFAIASSITLLLTGHLGHLVDHSASLLQRNRKGGCSVDSGAWQNPFLTNPHIRTLGADPFAGVGEQFSNDLVASLNVYSKSLRDRASLGAFFGYQYAFRIYSYPIKLNLNEYGHPTFATILVAVPEPLHLTLNKETALDQ